MKLKHEFGDLKDVFKVIVKGNFVQAKYPGHEDVTNFYINKDLDILVYEESKRGGYMWNIRKYNPLKCKNNRDYILIHFGKSTVLFHRLVAHTFLPEPEPEQTVVNHKNGNTLDNVPDNLEWCTQSENMQHAWRIGLMPRHYNYYGRYNHEEGYWTTPDGMRVYEDYESYKNSHYDRVKKYQKLDIDF